MSTNSTSLAVLELQAENDRLQRECLEWQAALHHAETEARQCGFSGSIREPGPALLEILAERDEARAQAARLAEALTRLEASGGRGNADSHGHNCGCVVCEADATLASTDDSAWLQSKINEATATAQARIAQLAEALEPFARRGRTLAEFDDWWVRCQAPLTANLERLAEERDITVQHLMRARATLASTDARKWMREEIAKELERRVDDLNSIIQSIRIMGSNTGQYEGARNRLITRIAELRREDR